VDVFQVKEEEEEEEEWRNIIESVVI